MTHDVPASPWVQRWAHLISPSGRVLDLACGSGRHLRWLAQQGFAMTGVDQSSEALAACAGWGELIQADLEQQPWPLMQGGQPRQFDAVVVTNYLWRPLLSVLGRSLTPQGVLIYETFAAGHERWGRPSRPDFLLQPGELLHAFADLQAVAYEHGLLDNPPRVVQRLVAVRPGRSGEDSACLRLRS